MTVPLVVDNEPITYRNDVWCPRCASFCGGEIWLLLRYDDGTIRLAHVRRCPECCEPV